MAFDTAEKRFSAIHLTKRSGLPVPSGIIGVNKRLHFIGIFSNIAPTITPSFFWRHRGLVNTFWRNRSTPLDGSTQ